MDLFRPYTIFEQSKNRLHLVESRGRRRFLFIFHRIFPFLLIGLLTISLITTFQAQRKDLPIVLILIMLALVLFVAIGMFTRAYLVELEIGHGRFLMKKQSWKGPIEQDIPFTDCEVIVVWMTGGRGGGIYYRLLLKNGKRMALLTIPPIHMSREKKEAINELLAELTGLQVVD